MRDNPCCGHAGCRPSTFDAAAHPHHCTVTPVERCPAYVLGRGCRRPVLRLVKS